MDEYVLLPELSNPLRAQGLDDAFIKITHALDANWTIARWNHFRRIFAVSDNKRSLLNLS